MPSKLSHTNRIAVVAVGLLALIIAIPVALRDTEVVDNAAAHQLVVVSPHNEAIRYEFEQAFARHCRARGLDVDIDWRTPGGTSEIVRFVRDQYLATFKQQWEQEGNAWSADVRNAVLDRRLQRETASAEQWQARQTFLNSDAGIGVDLFFGGGTYEYGQMADEGILVPCGVRERHPDWFEGPEPILEQEAAGEVWYDPGDRFYGACLSSFGLCFNPDRWQQLGLGDGEDSWPQHWDDLADPRLMGQIGAADPSKSGSITKCFEMLIQEKLAAAVAAHCPPAPTPTDLGAALAKGWEDAMLLIKEIGGNARYFTFSAGKVPVDVSDGAVVAGMCIDFYGRSQAEWSRRTLGRETLRYRTPVGGSSISADPIGLFRGAPHPETALMFIDFVLSPEGQRLWNYRVDTPGGPVRYSLRRLPIRRDLYADADRRQMADPEADPFLLASRFTYHPEWTGPLFNLMRLMIRVMIIDCHDELRDAWRAICENGGPETNPEAMELLARLPVTFADAPGVAREMRDSSRQIEILRAWAVFFRDSYRRARTAATATAR